MHCTQQFWMSTKKPNAILVYIYGGTMECGVIARKMVKTAKQVALNIQVIEHLEGTNIDQGRGYSSKKDACGYELYVISSTKNLVLVNKYIVAIRPKPLDQDSTHGNMSLFGSNKSDDEWVYDFGKDIDGKAEEQVFNEMLLRAFYCQN